MAAIRAVGSFSTVKELINRVLSMIPIDCGRVDLVTDSYRKISWKNATRAAREEGSFTIFQPAKVKIRDTNASYMKIKTSLSLSNISLIGLFTTEGKH